jgi:glycosyltransferase
MWCSRMRVSIITVVFNNAAHLSGAIESVFSQDYPSIEYIIIDGGSTDGTLDVVDKYRDCISVFLSEQDRGIYDALNKGISLSTGDVIGFLHSDDLFAHDSVISEIVQRFESDSVDVLYGDLDYVQVDEVERVVRHWKAGLFSRRKLKFGWMPPHPTVYMRREVYQYFGQFDLSYQIAADYDYLLRTFRDDELHINYFSEVLVKMRTGGISNRSLSNVVRKSIEDYRALKHNQVGGMMALFCKNIFKLPQFISRN